MFKIRNNIFALSIINRQRSAIRAIAARFGATPTIWIWN